MKLYDAIIGIVEKHIAPIAAKVGNQPHVRAMRDGFIVAMPFIIVGSFILIFAFPPFAEDTTNVFGRVWLNFATTHFDIIMMPFNMSMGIMTIFVSLGVAYSLAKAYKMDGYHECSTVTDELFVGRGTRQRRQSIDGAYGRHRDFHGCYVCFFCRRTVSLYEKA